MQSMLRIAEQKTEVKQTSKFQEHLELMQLKDELLMSHAKVSSPREVSSHPDVATDLVQAQPHWRVPKKVAFRAPPGLEDQLSMWLPQDTILSAPEDLKFAVDQDDATTDTGSGSDRDGDSSEDESPQKLSADAPEFCFGRLSASAPVFDPIPKLSADAPAFSFRTGLKSGAKLFVPGSTKTMLTSSAGLFVPSPFAATNVAEPVAPKAKTKLALVTAKSDLFVPSFPDLKASVQMKTKGQKKQ